MRQEPALIISVVIGGAVAALASLIGDFRAQYGTMLALIGYPFFILFGASLILLARYILIKLKIHTQKSYFISGGAVSVLLGLFIGFSGGGYYAGLVLALGIFSSFAMFAILSKTSYATDA